MPSGIPRRWPPAARCAEFAVASDGGHICVIGGFARAEGGGLAAARGGLAVAGGRIHVAGGPTPGGSFSAVDERLRPGE